MNELIELLNEYDEGGNWRKIHWKGLGCEDYDTIGYKDKELTCEQNEIISYLISKPYGFIKWLVDNDKIDFDKCGLDIKQYLSYNKRYNKGIVMAENYDYDTFKVREFYSPYEQLLMLLAISDEPINLLCSVLK